MTAQAAATPVPTVLLVEDDPGLRRGFRLALERVGYIVADAMDGRAAIAAIEACSPDLCVIDVRLPDCSGVDLARELRRLLQAPELPMVGMSGLSITFDPGGSPDSPLTEFLLKPIDPQVLVDVVRAYVPVRPDDPQPPGAGRSVLVADDDPLFRRLFQVYLRRAGYRVDTANHGVEALSLTRSLRPDCVVADALMPQIDGIRFCRELATDSALASIPVVLVTSSGADPSRLASAGELGAAVLLPRGRDPEALLAAVAEAIGRGPPKNEAARVNVDATQHRASLVRELEHQAALTSELWRVSQLQARQLSVLAGISEVLMHSPEPRAVLDETLTRCLDISSLTLGMAFIQDGGRLHLISTRGFPEGSGTKAAPRGASDLCGCAAILEIGLAQEDPLTVPGGSVPKVLSDRLLAALAASLVLVVPLAAAGERLGVLVLAATDRLLVGRAFAFARTIQGQVAQGLLLARTLVRLGQSEQRFRAVADHVADGLLVTDERGIIVYSNPTSAALLGLRGLAGSSVAITDLLPAFRNLEGEWEGQARAPGGRTFPVRVRTSDLMEGVGGMARTHLVRDVTESKRQEEYLLELINQDPLTGLANRRRFIEELARVVARNPKGPRWPEGRDTTPPGTPFVRFAVLYVDLDGFKKVNDQFGHAIGDALLIAVAEGLRSRLRGSDVVARLGGDEFAILHRRATLAQAQALARVVRSVVAEAGRDPRWKSVAIGASVGIALHPDHGNSAEEVLRQADAAMYRAKKEGKDGVAVALDPVGG